MISNSILNSDWLIKHSFANNVLTPDCLYSLISLIRSKKCERPYSHNQFLEGRVAVNASREFISYFPFVLDPTYPPVV